MSDPYRSLPDEVARQDDGQRLAESLRNLKVARAERERLLLLLADERKSYEDRIEALRKRLDDYESRYGGVDHVRSMRQELHQLKLAYAGALEQIEAFRKEPRR